MECHRQIPRIDFPFYCLHWPLFKQKSQIMQFDGNMNFVNLIFQILSADIYINNFNSEKYKWSFKNNMIMYFQQ